MSALPKDDDLELLTAESLSSKIASRPGRSSVTLDVLIRPERTAFGNLQNGQIPTDTLQDMKRQDNPKSVYFIRVDRWVKIGYADDVKKRLQAVKMHCPFPARLVASVEVSAQKVQTITTWPIRSFWDAGIWAESWFHQRFETQHHWGEWFEISDEDIAVALRDWTALS